MKEVEGKIFDILPEDILEKYPRNALSEVFRGTVISTYYILPDKTLRVNIEKDERFGNIRTYLTVKKLQKEESGFKVCKEENVGLINEKTIFNALDLLGYKIDKVVEKRRRTFVGDSGLRFEFDSMGGKNWVEIEANSSSLLNATIKYLGIDKHNVSAITTKEIYECQNKHV